MIMVTGGTGTLGRRLVPRLRDAGQDVRVLSRTADGPDIVRGDLDTGAGLDAALDGVDTVVHCASAQKGDEQRTRLLVDATAPDTHVVYISIVGIDRLSIGYYRAKQACERAIEESGRPHTILRTTQFYDLIHRGAALARWTPVAPVPSGVKVAPIEVDEVAARLTELALGGRAGRVPDMAGPEVSDAVDLVRRYARATGRRRLSVPLPLPGMKALRAGALVPDAGPGPGLGTWEQYLAAHR
jgi:uncharacterized protein YbjT (DUF2867 family)